MGAPMKCVAFDLGASSGKLFEGHIENDRLHVAPVYAFPNGIVRLGDELQPWDVA